MRRDRAKIIELNDQLRTTFKGGRVQMTPGVYDLECRLRGRALFSCRNIGSSTQRANTTGARTFSAAMRSNGGLNTAPPMDQVSQKIRPTQRQRSEFLRSAP
jgi:hypothetical protein